MHVLRKYRCDNLNSFEILNYCMFCCIRGLRVLHPLLDIDMGEAMGLLAALQWVKELDMVHMDFQTDSKVAAYSMYGKDDVSDFMAIINDCRHLLNTDLVNSDVKFIRRQVNGLHHTSLHIHLNIPYCISTLINNEKL